MASILSCSWTVSNLEVGTQWKFVGQKNKWMNKSKNEHLDLPGGTVDPPANEDTDSIPGLGSSPAMEQLSPRGPTTKAREPTAHPWRKKPPFDERNPHSAPRKACHPNTKTQCNQRLIDWLKKENPDTFSYSKGQEEKASKRLGKDWTLEDLCYLNAKILKMDSSFHECWEYFITQLRCICFITKFSVWTLFPNSIPYSFTHILSFFLSIVVSLCPVSC